MSIWLNNRNGSEHGGGQALVSVRVTKANGAVVDIAAAGDVMHSGLGGLSITEAGRQTELTRLEDGVLSCTVNNTGGDYTPGYASAPTMLELGMPIAVRETVGRRSWDLFTGTLNQPEAVYDSGLLDATVQVTAIDWSAGQENGRTFISNLAEWIVYNGGSDLTAYYPCGETGDRVRQFGSAVADREDWPIIEISSSSGGIGTEDEPRFSFGTEPALLGDDIPRPFMSPQLVPGATPEIAAAGWYPFIRFATPITVGSGEYLTLAWWASPSTTVHDSTYTIELSALGTDNILDIRRLLNSESPPGAWRARVKDAAISWNITAFAQSMSYGETLLHSVTISPSPGSLAFNSGARQSTGTVTGSPPPTFSFDTLFIGPDFVGSFSHIQIYKGNASSWSYDKHLAQYRQGLDPMTGGLRWQRTDERLLTLSQYAGRTAAECDFDRGNAYMARASLAGKTYKQAAADAVATEQGRLFTAGNGDSVFHNRARTRYSV